MNWKQKKILIACISLFLAVVIVSSVIILYLNVLKPAYLSYTANCIPNGEEIINKQGYVVSGAFGYNSETGNQTIYLNEYSDLQSLKHEWIHKFQFDNGRFYSCSDGLAYYTNEVEAYSGSYLPDFIFDRIYGNYLKD